MSGLRLPIRVLPPASSFRAGQDGDEQQSGHEYQSGRCSEVTDDEENPERCTAREHCDDEQPDDRTGPAPIHVTMFLSGRLKAGVATGSERPYSDSPDGSIAV